MGNQSTMVCSSKQSPALGQEYHITCIPGLSAAPKDQVPQGAALPHGVTGAPPAQPHTPAGPGALPHHGQQQGRALTARGAQHRANSDPHCVLETALTTAPSPAPLPPSSSPTTGEMQQNTAGKAVSIHSPGAAPASPSPAKRMRAHTQIIFNLYFNTACKCTAER